MPQVGSNTALNRALVGLKTYTTWASDDIIDRQKMDSSDSMPPAYHGRLSPAKAVPVTGTRTRLQRIVGETVRQNHGVDVDRAIVGQRSR